jgi:flagellar biosynthesis protein
VKKAVALRYDKNADQAPVIIAMGQGEVAERIVALAKKHEILTQENPELAMLLCQQELGDFIPVEAYKAVAEIIVYLYKQGKQT